MKKISKVLLILLFVFVSLFCFACNGKEKIIPHLELQLENSSLIDNENYKINLEFGDVIDLNPVFVCEDGNINEGIEVSISDDKALLLDGNIIKAYRIGESTLTTHYKDANGIDYTLSYIVKVDERVNEIERLLISSNNVVNVGSCIDITVNKFGANSDEVVKYISSDENILYVDEDGVATGIGAGSVKVTAFVERDGKKIEDTMNINVIDFGDATTIQVDSGSPANQGFEARYLVNEATEYSYLPYGVLFQKITAMTSTPLDVGADADGYSGITAPLIPNQYYLQQVSLLEVPSTSDIKITTWANWPGGNTWKLTTVKGLISNYEKNNPGWKVIAAINGDFFDINANGNLPYQTSSVVISDGNFYKTTGGGLVGFKNDGTGLVGNKPLQRTEKMILAIYDENNEIIKEFDIDAINDLEANSETILYFASYNEEKNIMAFDIDVDENTFVVGEAEMALPNNANDFYGRGVISSASGTVSITKGNFAIRSTNPEIKKYLHDGVKVRVQYELIGDYKDIKDATGCGGTFLSNGEYDTAGAINDRAPRTCIGYTEDGRVIMMVIDGRQGKKNMYGADSREMAAIMKAYGCVEAYNLDGGGSSTMVIRKNGTFIVTNSPSDGRERTDSNCLLIVVKDMDLDVNISDITESSAKIKVTINDSFGKDVKKLYARIDNTLYELNNGELELNNLVHNTSYKYTICYEDSKGNMFDTLTGGEIKTNKKIHTYLLTEVTNDSETFTIHVIYLDVDQASTIGGSKVVITSIKDGQEVVNTTFLDGKGVVTLKKSIVGDEIKKIDISYSYQLDYINRIPVDMTDVEFIYK